MYIRTMLAALSLATITACATPPTAPVLEKGRAPPDGSQSIVQVIAVSFSGDHAQGSAFVYDTDRGLLLTAPQFGHERIAYTLKLANGESRRGTYLGKSEKYGFTLLATDLPSETPALQLARTAPRAGETATVVGISKPSGAPDIGTYNANVSTVSIASSEAGGDAISFLQLTGPLPSGTYGGAPVLNATGEVIGIIAATTGIEPAASIGPATFAAATYGLAPHIEAVVAATSSGTETQ